MDRLNMDRIAQRLRAQGIAATIERTGGNVGTIMVGDPVEGRYQALAGPGVLVETWDGPRNRTWYSHVGDFGIYLDDDATALPVHPTTEDQAVGLLAVMARPRVAV